VQFATTLRLFKVIGLSRFEPNPAITFSMDAGESFINTFEQVPSLNISGCQTSILSVGGGREGAAGKLIISGPFGGGGRENMTISVNFYDGAGPWQQVLQLSPHPTSVGGYSALAETAGSGSVLCLWETMSDPGACIEGDNTTDLCLAVFPSPCQEALEQPTPSSTEIKLLPVFKAGDRNESGFSINTFRIPGFVVANGTLVVAAEARMYTVEDLSPHHLVVKRSTDNGQTWGPLQTVVSPERVWGAAEGGPHGGAVFDPTPVYDALQNTIHIIFSYKPSKYVNWSSCVRQDNQTGPCTSGAYINCTEIDPTDPFGQQLFSVSSTDLGASWTFPRNLSFAGGKTWCAKSGGGGGNGIQLRNGRLVVPGYHAGCSCRANPNGVTGPSCLKSHVLIADPQDATGTQDPTLPAWRLSDEFFPGSAEGSVAELPAAVSKGRTKVDGNRSGGLPGTGELDAKNSPSRLIFVSRLERLETNCVPSASHCAGIMYSDDGGETWGEERDDGQLLDPMCKNTVARARCCGFQQRVSLEDAIEFYAFAPLEALAHVRTMAFLSGCPLFDRFHCKLRPSTEGGVNVSSFGCRESDDWTACEHYLLVLAGWWKELDRSNSGVAASRCKWSGTAWRVLCCTGAK
jgi:hypothetical protein